jgi:predicted pyridoxine 5'-phosphate oxidase superfamily flavin-nucleotide-binding protein
MFAGIQQNVARRLDATYTLSGPSMVVDNPLFGRDKSEYHRNRQAITQLDEAVKLLGQTVDALRGGLDVDLDIMAMEDVLNEMYHQFGETIRPQEVQSILRRQYAMFVETHIRKTFPRNDAERDEMIFNFVYSAYVQIHPDTPLTKVEMEQYYIQGDFGDVIEEVLDYYEIAYDGANPKEYVVATIQGIIGDVNRIMRDAILAMDATRLPIRDEAARVLLIDYCDMVSNVNMDVSDEYREWLQLFVKTETRPEFKVWVEAWMDSVGDSVPLETKRSIVQQIDVYIGTTASAEELYVRSVANRAITATLDENLEEIARYSVLAWFASFGLVLIPSEDWGIDEFTEDDIIRQLKFVFTKATLISTQNSYQIHASILRTNLANVSPTLVVPAIHTIDHRSVKDVSLTVNVNATINTVAAQQELRQSQFTYEWHRVDATGDHVIQTAVSRSPTHTIRVSGPGHPAPLTATGRYFVVVSHRRVNTLVVYETVVYTSMVATIRIRAKCLRDGAVIVAGAPTIFGECEFDRIPDNDAFAAIRRTPALTDMATRLGIYVYNDDPYYPAYDDAIRIHTHEVVRDPVDLVNASAYRDETLLQRYFSYEALCTALPRVVDTGLRNESLVEDAHRTQLLQLFSRYHTDLVIGACVASLLEPDAIRQITSNINTNHASDYQRAQLYVPPTDISVSRMVNSLRFAKRLIEVPPMVLLSVIVNSDFMQLIRQAMGDWCLRLISHFHETCASFHFFTSYSSMRASRNKDVLLDYAGLQYFRQRIDAIIAVYGGNPSQVAIKDVPKPFVGRHSLTTAHPTLATLVNNNNTLTYTRGTLLKTEQCLFEELHSTIAAQCEYYNARRRDRAYPIYTIFYLVDAYNALLLSLRSHSLTADEVVRQVTAIPRSQQ